MTWTYSISEASARDQIRGKIGDTRSSSDYDLDDETIDAIYVLYPSVVAASVECVKRIIAKKSRKFDRSAMGMSASQGSVLTQLRDLLTDLQREQMSGAGRIFVGGVSDSANTTQRADTDYVQPSFIVGGDDYPGT